MTPRPERRPFRSNGLRPLDLSRDRDAIADLIDLCFRSEIATRPGVDTRNFRRELTTVHLLSRLVPATRDLLTGFVWQQDGRLVGNISLSRLTARGDRWLIGNVAVHPDYRRQGIARRLTETAVDFVRARRGRLVVLDVRAENAPAYELYRLLGFRRVASVAKLSRGPWLGPVSLGPPDVEVRRATAADGARLYELAVAATPPAGRELMPPRPDDFQPGLFGRLQAFAAQAILGRRAEWYLAGVAGEPSGVLLVERQPPRPARFVLTVPPDRRGEPEEALIGRAHSLLTGRPQGRIVAEVDADHRAVLQILRARGFTAVETLDRLALPLDEPRG